LNDTILDPSASTVTKYPSPSLSCPSTVSSSVDSQLLTPLDDQSYLASFSSFPPSSTSLGNSFPTLLPYQPITVSNSLQGLGLSLHPEQEELGEGELLRAAVSKKRRVVELEVPSGAGRDELEEKEERLKKMLLARRTK
jgi:hypothetical protein